MCKKRTTRRIASAPPVHDGISSRFASADKNKKKVVMEGEVVVGLRLYALRDVSHQTHTFHAAFRCFYDWIDPELTALLLASGTDGGALDEAEWSKKVPEMTFTNAASVQAEPWPHPPRVLDAATGRVYVHRRYEGAFNERLMMHDFPFDDQSLVIRMQLSKSRFRAHCVRMLPLELRAVPSIPGWSLVMPRNERSADELVAAYRSKAIVAVTFTVRREAGFYVRCIMSLQALLTTLSFVSFMLMLDGVWDRVEFELALIFALMALRFAAADAIPVVPYITTLDAYNNYCIIMLCILGVVQGAIYGAFRRAIEPSVSEGLSREQETLFNTLDVYLAGGGLALWALFNCAFFYRVSRRMGKDPLLISSSKRHDDTVDWTAPWTEKDYEPPWRMSEEELHSEPSSPAKPMPIRYCGRSTDNVLATSPEPGAEPRPAASAAAISNGPAPAGATAPVRLGGQPVRTLPPLAESGGE